MSDLPTLQGQPLKHIIEAALLAADEPLTHARLAALFSEDAQPSNQEIGKALEQLASDCADRGVELQEVASGFRLQVRSDLQPWVARLWTEKPQKYSRAMLETLALIAYRQPITRGEIESVRGVSLSSNIIRSLQEREWVRIVGHRDVPGKPALFGTTRAFLDYFNLSSLDQLPTLAEIKDMENLEPELAFDPGAGAGAKSKQPETTADADVAADHEDAGTGMDDTDPPVAKGSDEDLDEGDLDQAFADLDRAFGEADNIDLGKDAPEGDAGVDPDSPQGDMVAKATQEPDKVEHNDKGQDEGDEDRKGH